MKRRRPEAAVRLLVLLAVAILGAPAVAPSGPGDVSERFGWLIGEWQGQGVGFGNVSAVTHEWDLALQGKFLRLHTRSVSVRADSTEEVHEDIGFLSRDVDHDAFVFRQFLSEGYVNTFTVVREEGERNGFAFRWKESESAGGMRAEMFLTRLSGDEYEMVLSLAGPGKDFVPCQTMTMKRLR